MQNAQNKKTSDAQIRATNKYHNSKWRPNVFLDMDKREVIENRISSLGLSSFNEYVKMLIDKDMNGVLYGILDDDK